MTDDVVLIETNLDDQSPETFGWLAERLFADGALDVWYAPIVMKKGRPAYQLSVLTEPEKVEALSGRVLRETTTFGVRIGRMSRRKLERTFERVETPHGSVTVKVGTADGVHKIAPEYEDCRRLAETAGVPIREVYDAAIRAYARKSGS